MKLLFRAGLIFLLGLSLMADCLVFAQEASTEQQSAQGATQQAASSESAAGAETQGAGAPVMEIKRLDTEVPLYSFELRDVDITDLFRVLAHDYKLNLMVDKDVQGKVTATLTSVSLDEALQTIAESQNLVLNKRGNVIYVVPNLVTKIFTLKYLEANSILQASTASSSAAGSTQTTTQGTQATGSTLTQASTIFDLLSSRGKVLLGQQPNSIIVIDYPPNIKKVEDYLKIIDQRMASKVFKLKYLKASDVVGIPVTASATSTSATTSATTGVSSTGGS